MGPADFLRGIAQAVFGMRWNTPAMDAETARQIRGEQVSAVVELVPLSATANLVSATVILTAFHDRVSGAFLGAWTGAQLVFAAMSLRNWARTRERAITNVSQRAVHRITLNAVILSVLWGLAVLVLMPDSDAYHQLVLQMLVMGMAAGGAFGLSTIPVGAISYVWILVTTSTVAMLLTGKWQSIETSLLVAMFWTLYGTYLTRNIAIHAHRFLENARNRVDLTEKGAVIGLLLNDFQEHGSDWLWETDVEGRIVEPSRRFAEVAGRTTEELSGMPLRALRPASRRRASTGSSR